MAFLKSFDELLNNLLTDYRNRFAEADTSQGSLIFIKCACMASALWGLYNYQNWISRQLFPDTSETEALEHHAWVRGVSRTYLESDASLLSRLLDFIRRPPAGGTKSDYIKWARSVDNVANAYCFPLAQGLGTVDVVVLANAVTTGSEIPGQPILDAVTAAIDAARPVTSSMVRILAPAVLTENVTMVVTGARADKTQIAADIEAYLLAMEPKQPLYLTQLAAIAITNGAENADISAPAEDIVPTLSETMIRPGVISVT
jgi:uncharacterized phage protein gp47/JayE